MPELETPTFKSDFDGTAVQLAKKISMTNFLKYPLPMVPGYDQFLHEINQSDVLNQGIVSRRLRIEQRRNVTARSIEELGLAELLPEVDPFVLMGNEARKAEAIVAGVGELALGFIDDKPHKIGAEILKLLTTDPSDPSDHERHIVLGVVGDERRSEYVAQLLKLVEYLPVARNADSYGGQLTYGGSGMSYDISSIGQSMRQASATRAEAGAALEVIPLPGADFLESYYPNFTIVGEAPTPFRLSVVDIGAYTPGSGEDFAKRLHAA